MTLLFKIIAFFFLIVYSTIVSSQTKIIQTKNLPGKSTGIKKAKGLMVLDGKLDEQDWNEADVAKDFYLNYPVDTAQAPFQTEARLTFDDHALYVSFVCHDDNKPFIVQSLRRDFDFNANDNMGLVIGPYNDGLNGFYFLVTPYGVQAEGTISGGGAQDNSFSDTWDNKWYSKVIRYEDKWVAELMIPFKSFRFKDHLKEWNIGFLRYDLKRNTISSWISTPIQFFPAAFAYTGKLMWDEVPKATTNISVIPYVAGGTSNDKTTVPDTKQNDLTTGFDAKIGVTPSMNLDLTVNPDFSQVEVDRQVINLTRFEFQFPERRQFFLENKDLFETIGGYEARSFFSRRIGLARDSTGTLKKVPILYGARLSGSLSKKWRMSVLNMQTKEKLDLGLPSQNFTVAAIQHNFWKQSSIEFSLVNKQSLGITEADSLKYYSKDLWKYKKTGSDSVKVLNNFNRVVGIDIESRSHNNTWYASAYYSRSLDGFSSGNNQSAGGYITHTKRTYSFYAYRSLIQKNYNAEAGYVPSKGVYPGIETSLVGYSRTFYPKNSPIVKMGPLLDLSMANIPSGTVTDRAAYLGYKFFLMNTSSLVMTYSTVFQQMTNNFNPIDADKYTNFLVGEQYSWSQFLVTFQSDQRKLFRYIVGSSYGGFYNGTNLNINGEINYRYQPYGSISIKFDYNDLNLPDNYGKGKYFVVSPRFDLTFTRTIFFTTFVQYNTLLDNVNLNARFQWRYKPASDFYIVYTENYLPENMSSKNHSLVFKLTYWFNI